MCGIIGVATTPTAPPTSISTSGGLAAILREADSAFFDRWVIEEPLDLQRRGYRNAQRLFALAVFELWRREYRVGLP